MDQDFNDITIKDTEDRINIFKLLGNIVFFLFIVFVILSVFITIININKISDNEKGYLVYHITTDEKETYTVRTSYYLLYKIVRVDNKNGSNSYFRFWFMNDIDY